MSEPSCVEEVLEFLADLEEEAAEMIEAEPMRYDYWEARRFRARDLHDRLNYVWNGVS